MRLQHVSSQHSGQTGDSVAALQHNFPRGVNRSPLDPLQVHVRADAALPLVHGEVTTWELAAADVFRKMLLAVIAVDSPADALALHRDLFKNAEQANKQFQRVLFKGQSSYRDPIRGMSLKSAAYRRAGRRRGWRRARCVSGLMGAADARAALEHAIGEVAEWQAD